RGVRMEDVIFAGTRDRKPTGMAEVSLTLIDPQVYEGQISGEPEIDIQDDMPLGMNDDDWDEASARAAAAEATEAHVAEVQPGPLDWKEGIAAAEGESPEAGSEATVEVAQDATSAEAQAEGTESQAAAEAQSAPVDSQSPTAEPNAEAAQNAASPV